MVNCDPDDFACYDKAGNTVERYYFACSHYLGLVQGMIATLGVLLLFLWHRKRNVSSFIVAISILLVSSAIAAYSFSLSSVLFYNAWVYPIRFSYAQWIQLQAPCREMAVFLSTWAHWLFAEKYL